jgi:hypothetical protein
MSKQAEEKGLAEAYQGIPGMVLFKVDLYGMRFTDFTTEPVRKVAAAFTMIECR